MQGPRTWIRHGFWTFRI